MSDSSASILDDHRPEQAPYNVLFLCTGNSARSILGETILNKIGLGRFCAYSAGSHPRGEVHPQTLALLKEQGFDTANLRSKSWNEFVKVGAPSLDFVITVCETKEACPSWPGQPINAHWSMPDPAIAGPEEVAYAFAETYRALQGRLSVFVNLNISGLARLSLQRQVNNIADLK